MVIIDTSFTFFQQLIKDQFPEQHTSGFEFINDWSSIQLLLIINAIDEKYDVLIDHKEIKKNKNLKELHKMVIEKTL